MQLKNFDKLKKKYKGYSNSIDSFKNYLSELERKHVDVIEPNILSRRLKIPYGEAIHLLSIAERYNILKKAYQVFTIGDNHSLGEYEDTSEIPDAILNDATGNYISKDDFFIDLVFHIPSNLEV